MQPIIKFKMNNKDKLMLLFSIAFLAFIVLIFIQAVRVEVDEEQEVFSPKVEVETQERQSISFIMGVDRDMKNPFYSNAEDYFRYHPEAKTDELVNSCRSLECLKNEINRYYQLNQKPYETINIVVHSNPWSGLSLPIIDGGERITAELLEEAYQNNIIEAIQDEIVDRDTKIIVHACGLGNNEALTNSLKKVIGGNDGQVPEIISSKNYVNFTNDNEQYFKSEMQAFYAFYPTAYKPADLHLARQLSNRYPNEDLEWLSAIQDENISASGAAFSYRYNVPIEWKVEYPEYDIPELATQADQMEWLMNQDELMEIIEKTEIPFDYFRWKVKKGSDVNETNFIETPYIRVNGKVTVLCILKKATEARSLATKA